MDPSSEARPPSIWSTKPWWCQPWTILLTGLALPLVSWLWLHRIWITLPLAGFVALWWGVFLVLVPRAYQEQQLGLSAHGTGTKKATP